MTKNDKNDKIVKFIKKSQKLMSTKNNNLLTSRTAERHARGQKMRLGTMYKVHEVGNSPGPISSKLGSVFFFGKVEIPGSEHKTDVRQRNYTSLSHIAKRCTTHLRG